MGKKDKNKKKGKGAEKTAAKTDKKLSQKQKKELAAIGEDDIEKIVAEIEQEEKKRQEVIEQVVSPPSRRVNFTLTAHPDKEELILFGGEFFNGSKITLHTVDPDFEANLENLISEVLDNYDGDDSDNDEDYEIESDISTDSEQEADEYDVDYGIGEEEADLGQTERGGYFYGKDKCLKWRMEQPPTNTFVYNDMYFYNIPRNEWVRLKAPGGPAPRCGHQTVALSTGKGQLWVFGGEYASPTQAQFYHYRDLWLFHMSLKKWEKINVSGGPSSRSGHRMVCVKKQLLVFGGFHDNLRDYKYFNDVYSFNLETYTWKRIEPTGTPPAPRSGCIMLPLSDGRVLIYGGYSKEKIKRDVDKGVIHSDMFLLTPEKNDTTGLKWKWVTVKQSGARIPPRCSMTGIAAPGNKAYSFGGVFDIVEEEEDLAGTFYNDLYTLDLEKTIWRTVTLSGKKDNTKQRRRRKKEKNDVSNEGEDSDEATTEMETLDIQENTVPAEASASTSVISDDGIFKVTMGPATSSSQQASAESVGDSQQIFSPSPRMNCGLAVKHGILYLYGGLVEDGPKQYTLSDFYSLDLHKLDEWRIIIPNDQESQEWLESGSDSDESGTESESESEESESGEQMEVD
ncbi:hypothetical protein C0J52_06872 [Blattella germanica]|nr:hypothetical protein C0J52_06872 [Blattella germanica]